MKCNPKGGGGLELMFGDGAVHNKNFRYSKSGFSLNLYTFPRNFDLFFKTFFNLNYEYVMLDHNIGETKVSFLI